MKGSNLNKAKSISRKLESMILLLQGSAESGTASDEIYSDTLEVLADMATDLRNTLNEVKGSEAVA